MQPPELIKCSNQRERELGIEYDMDEEDHVWLELINSNRAHFGFKDVSQDQFEGVMDRLEKDCIIESNKPAKNAREIDDEAVCCVCNDGEVTNLFNFDDLNKRGQLSVRIRTRFCFAICATWPSIKSVTECLLFPRASGSVGDVNSRRRVPSIAFSANGSEINTTAIKFKAVLK